MRLIDADALKIDYIYPSTTAGTLCYRYVSKEQIDRAPTIDDEPVRRGMWTEHPHEREWDVCSCCKIGTKRREFGMTDDGREWVTEESYTYCPWCGAKME